MTTGSPASRATVAAFDVDGTLTWRDNVLPFLLRTAGPRLPLALARRPATLARALLRRDRDVLKELACSALAGLTAASVHERGVAFAHEIRAHRLRADTFARLRRHQALGHPVVLVSASLDAYLEPLGSLLGVHGILCTRLGVDQDGRLTGRLAGPNCRGPEKASRMRAWLDDNGLPRAELWAYGDSSGDDALLAIADHPVRVRRARVPPEPVPADVV